MQTSKTTRKVLAVLSQLVQVEIVWSELLGNVPQLSTKRLALRLESLLALLQVVVKLTGLDSELLLDVFS